MLISEVFNDKKDLGIVVISEKIILYLVRGYIISQIKKHLSDFSLYIHLFHVRNSV